MKVCFLISNSLGMLSQNIDQKLIIRIICVISCFNKIRNHDEKKKNKEHEMEKRRLIIVVLGSSNKTKRLKSFSFEIENDAEIVDRYVDIQFIANDHREEFDIY